VPAPLNFTNLFSSQKPAVSAQQKVPAASNLAATLTGVFTASPQELEAKKQARMDRVRARIQKSEQHLKSLEGAEGRDAVLLRAEIKAAIARDEKSLLEHHGEKSAERSSLSAKCG
jgi:hypothetical protein